VADEPAELSEESVYRLLEAIISLRRKAIDADFLLHAGDEIIDHRGDFVFQSCFRVAVTEDRECIL
jgi:hypothetical protein